jgi:hypothetical protein
MDLELVKIHQASYAEILYHSIKAAFEWALQFFTHLVSEGPPTMKIVERNPRTGREFYS